MILLEYLEYGKNVIMNCANMDLSATAQKRRQVLSPTSSARRPKRRKKNKKRGSFSSDLDQVADDCDVHATAYVDHFAKLLRETRDRWFLSLCSRMLQAISHFIVEPAAEWKRRADILLGVKDETDEPVEEPDGDGGEKDASDSDDDGSLSDEE